MSRVVFATGMVAAAWALAITGLVAVGDAKAEAAWLKTGTGTSAAKAIRLLTPGQPAVTAKTCTGNGYSISVSWSYSGSLPPLFDIYGAINKNAAPTVIGTATTTSVTLTGLSAKPAVVSVRASAGSWHGTRSAEVDGC